MIFFVKCVDLGNLGKFNDVVKIFKGVIAFIYVVVEFDEYKVV